MEAGSDLTGYLGQVIPVRFEPPLLVLSYLVSLVGAASTLELMQRRTSRRGYSNKLVLLCLLPPTTRHQRDNRVKMASAPADIGALQSPPPGRVDNKRWCLHLEHGRSSRWSAGPCRSQCLLAETTDMHGLASSTTSEIAQRRC